MLQAKIVKKNSGSLYQVNMGNFVLEIVPKLGGKIKSLISQNSGRDFFFKDPRNNYSGQGYLGHDISGWDECFPNVGKTKGIFRWDHGVLWDKAWQIEVEKDKIITYVNRPNGLPINFFRVLQIIDKNKLRFKYKIENLSNNKFPFIYSAHPILAPDNNTRVIIPGIKFLKVLGHNGKFKAKKRQAWPKSKLLNNNLTRWDTNFTPDREIAGKWFARGINQVEIAFPKTNERLGISWDKKSLPYLGLWISLGLALAGNKKDARKWNCLALEPTNWPNDTINKCQQVPKLQPKGSFSFWIDWQIKGKYISSD